MKTKKLLIIPIALAIFILSANSCKKDDDKNKPSLTTSQINDITPTTATSGGSITADGGAPITARGVVWGIDQNPTVDNNTGKTNDGTGTGSFISNITSLAPNTTYYVRAYATNSVGTTYGTGQTFKTLDGIAALTTSAISNITLTSATSGGSITTDGGAPITVRGVVWDTVQNPTVESNTGKTSDGTGKGSFTSSLAGLTPNTIYYVRAYATNSIGTEYGTERTFKTKDGVISLTTMVVTSITATSATSGGSITSDGGTSITARGVCWSTSQNPTLADIKTSDGAGTGSFSSSLTGLASNTTFYVRAYATNSVGTTYGNDVSFKTLIADGTTGSVTYNGYTYKTVYINGREWFAENLRTTAYNDGVVIPYVIDNGTWVELTASAYCWYGNDQTTYGNMYGALYNWYAVSTGKLAPEGWHIPTYAEGVDMKNYLIANGYNYDGTTSDNKIAKSLATATGWNPSTITGAPGNTDYPNKMNATGFSALPGGVRGKDGYSTASQNGMWWSSTATSDSTALYVMYIYSESPYIYQHTSYNADKATGFSVRCVKN